MVATLIDSGSPPSRSRYHSPGSRWLLPTAAVLCVTLSCREPARPVAEPRLQPAPSREDRLVISATGDRFQWMFRYPGSDHRLGTSDDILLGRHLRLPAGRNVRVEITSSDYVYTFAIPELGLRQIAVPKLSYSLEIRTDKIGTYELRTDPMCGYRLYHDDVMGTVSIESPDRFDSWMQSRARR